MSGSTGSEAKRHHTVPRFYLEHFADQGSIKTIELPGDRSFTQNVRKAASETHFYRIKGHEDGDNAFEDALSVIEGNAAQIFRNIIAGDWPLPPDDRMSLAYFVALQKMRGPDQRRNIEHVIAQTTRLEIGYGGKAGVKGWYRRRHGVEISDERAALLWAEATQLGGPPIRVDPAVHIQEIVENANRLLPYIAGRPWALYEFKKRSLILSDSPIGLVRNEFDLEPMDGVGFGTAWGITFPLTRKFGILMSDPRVFADLIPVDKVHEGKMDLRADGTTLIERMFNEQTVDSASQRLYHHPDDSAFVPQDLPQPRPTSMSMSGFDQDFSGEPYF